jgi:uncharacterized RDD family membrane protein YckC
MAKYIFFVSRAAAYVLDYLMFYAAMYLTSKYGILSYIISFLVLFLYRYLTTSFLGATFGMKAFKLKLIRYDHKICLKREIYRAASAFFFIGYIYAMFDAKRRTLHDIASKTMVVYGESKEDVPKSGLIPRALALILLVISAMKWSTGFILDDIGGIGLKKVCTSDEYYQNFDGDNLLSLSQDELYMKTLGRKYTAVVDYEDGPYITRISNKLTYTEVYKLHIDNQRITGEYIYKLNMPVQFLCSGRFKDSTRDLCGVSPKNNLVFIDSKGSIYGETTIGIPNIVTLRCGDIDDDGQCEAAVLGRSGDMEIFKYKNGGITKLFSGKIGEDIVPQAFYIDNGIVVSGTGADRSILYFYGFMDGRFKFKDKKAFEVEKLSNMEKLNDDIIISYVSRNNMTFKTGKIQRLEVYSTDKKVKRLYNFGSRPGRKYAYMVRTLEDVTDIDVDGTEEVILKATGSRDIQGQGYIVEVYKLSRAGLIANRILSKIQDIL